MSELRDLTAALRTLSNRMTSIEDCLVIVVRNSEQESHWRHEQRNIEQRREGEDRERDIAVRQIQTFCGELSHKFTGLHEAVENMGKTRHSDVRALNERVGRLERFSEPDEVTKT